MFQHLEEMALSELRGDCKQASKGECLAGVPEGVRGLGVSEQGKGRMLHVLGVGDMK